MGALDVVVSPDPQPAISAATARLAGTAARIGWRPYRPAAARPPARPNTSSSIDSVSLPVKVFCWLGW